MEGLRITAGSLKGRVVPLPPHDLRPTSSKARQAFFNIVGPRVVGAHFLDLFSGSGIFSLEAVSRGAHDALAIDKSREAIRSLTRCATSWGVPVTGMQGDVLRLVSELPLRSFDVIYADPPFAFDDYATLIESLEPVASASAVVAIEHATGRELPSVSPMQAARTARYGNVSISFYERITAQEDSHRDDLDTQ